MHSPKRIMKTSESFFGKQSAQTELKLSKIACFLAVVRIALGPFTAFWAFMGSESKTTQPVHIYDRKASIWLLNHENRLTGLRDTYRTSFGAF